MYKIIKALTTWGLERQANKLIADGFEPTGGISTKWGFYMQAFHKPAEYVWKEEYSTHHHGNVFRKMPPR